LDRLARTEPLDAINQLQQILQFSDVAILSTNQYFTKGSLANIGDLVRSLFSAATAHEESQKKSERGLKNWEFKRELAAKKHQPITASTRCWLKLDKGTNSFNVIESVASIVKTIFKLSIEGQGVKVITDTLNLNPKQYPPIDGKPFNTSWVQKTLKSKAVLGQIEMYKMVDKKRVLQGVVEDYYPRIISDETYNLARVRAEQRKRNGSGRKGENGQANLFQRLIKCGDCGATVILKRTGASAKHKIKSKKYLICDSAYRKITINPCNVGKFWNYKEFSDLFFKFITELDFDSLQNDETKANKTNLIDQIAATEFKLKELAIDSIKLNQRILKIDDDLVQDFNSMLREMKDSKTKYEELLKKLNSELLNFSSLDDGGLKKTILDFDILSNEKRIELGQILKNQIEEIRFFNGYFNWQAGDDVSDLDHKLLEICIDRGYKTKEKVENYMMTEAGARLLDKFTRKVIITFKNQVTRTIFGAGYSYANSIRMVAMKERVAAKNRLTSDLP
jgi:hypothetical protein